MNKSVATVLQALTSLRIFGSLLTLCLLLAACKDSKVNVVMSTTDESNPPAASRPGAMQGPDQVVWRLVHWTENRQTVSLVPQAPITLTLERGGISGSGGCNQFGAAYREVGGSIVIDPIAATKRGCEQPKMDQENRFFAALQRVHQVRYGPNQQLTLHYGAAQTAGTLTFRAPRSP